MWLSGHSNENKAWRKFNQQKILLPKILDLRYMLNSAFCALSSLWDQLLDLGTIAFISAHIRNNSGMFICQITHLVHNNIIISMPEIEDIANTEFVNYYNALIWVNLK